MTVENYVNPLIKSDPCESLFYGKPFVVFDTETTGLQSDDEIVELGIIDAGGNELYHSFFKPEKKIDPAATAVSGIDNEGLKNAPLFKDEYQKILDIMRGNILVGHNVQFDLRLMRQTAGKYGLDVDAFNDIAKYAYDTCNGARGLIKPKPINYKLATLIKLIGVEEEQKHRASYDCLDCLRLLRYLNALQHDVYAPKDAEKTAKPVSASKPVSSISMEDAYRKTVEMLKQGCSFEETATAVERSMSTVEKYAIQAIEEHLLDEKMFLDSTTANRIALAAASIADWDGKMKPVKDVLVTRGYDISYFQIKLVFKKSKFWQYVNGKRRK